jgi:hypothetical protein
MVQVFDEADIATLQIGRNGNKIAEIKKTLKEKYLKKPGTCCLFNQVVRMFGKEGKSDPGLHSQLRNAFKKDSEFKVMKKDDRLVIVRYA